MKTLARVEDMASAAQAAKAAGLRVGLVPTMGALHEGHVSLMRLARARCDLLVVSLFVNRIQFGTGEDFERYPRDPDADGRLCAGRGVDILFAPDEAEVYAPGHSVFVEETVLSTGLCGAVRPGHFKGVTTVVAKLFNIVLPDVAVFGQKDAQQLQVLRRMTRDLNFPVEIVAAPIVREVDGLAMSSRNRYLSPAEREQALCLSRALAAARRLFAAGERGVAALEGAMMDVLAAEPAARVEYAVVVDADTLGVVQTVAAPVLAALAVRIGRTRLIDNAILLP